MQALNNMTDRSMLRSATFWKARAYRVYGVSGFSRQLGKRRGRERHTFVFNARCETDAKWRHHSNGIFYWLVAIQWKRRVLISGVE